MGIGEFSEITINYKLFFIIVVCKIFIVENSKVSCDSATGLALLLV